MKEIVFCDFFGVGKVVYGGDGVCQVGGIYVDGWDREWRVRCETGDGVKIGKLTGDGIDLDFSELVKERVDRCKSLGLDIQAKGESEFLCTGGCDLSAYSKIDERERAFLYNIYKCIGIDNIHYKTLGGRVRAICTEYDGVEDFAKTTTLLRYLIKREGGELSPTFIPKPYLNCRGVGFSISFRVQGERRVLDNFLSGLLLHAPEYVVFTNSCVNSYVRLGGRDCTHYVCWGEGDGALIQVKGGATEREFTLRFPDASGNPYLVIGALLESGIMGVAGDGKLPDGIRDLTPGAVSELVRLPLSLQSALSVANGSGFLRRVLGESVGNAYFKIKTKECEQFTDTSTEEEYREYYAERL